VVQVSKTKRTLSNLRQKYMCVGKFPHSKFDDKKGWNGGEPYIYTQRQFRSF
jgi:hypothetical protein